MATATERSRLAKLREKFPVEQVKQRPGGRGRMLDYVAIETVLERLLTVAPDYAWELAFHLIEGTTATIGGHLTIEGKSVLGVGSMTNNDLDMAVKSANSEAIKNAAKNGWGVALELWDEDHRQQLDAERQGVSSSGNLTVVRQDDELTELKNRVADIAVAAGANRTGPAIAAYFGIEVEKLQDRAVLEELISKNAPAL